MKEINIGLPKMGVVAADTRRNLDLWEAKFGNTGLSH
jgi:hypothetical protein